MPSSDQIRGMFVPVPTPFLENGELDEELFGKMVSHYVDAGANAVFLFGSYGQGPAMTSAQRMRGLEVALAAAQNRVPVVPQVGAVDPFTARELAAHAKTQGVAAIAMVGPYYYADRTEQELLRFYQMVDAAAKLPMFLYNNPAYQGYSLTPPLMKKLREAVPNIFGVKMAKGNLGDIISYRATMGENFKLFAPQENLLPGLMIGQTGTVSPPLTLAIKVGVALIAAVDRGDLEEAMRIQLRLLRFHQQLRSIKQFGRALQAEGLRYIGFPVRQYPRWPGDEMTGEAKAVLHQAIDEVNQTVVV